MIEGLPPLQDAGSVLLSWHISIGNDCEPSVFPFFGCQICCFFPLLLFILLPKCVLIAYVFYVHFMGFPTFQLSHLSFVNQVL